MAEKGIKKKVLGKCALCGANIERHEYTTAGGMKCVDITGREWGGKWVCWECIKGLSGDIQ